MPRLKSTQAFRQFLETRRERRGFAGKSNYVAPFVGFNDRSFSAECLVDPGNVAVISGIVSAEVNHEDAVRAQGAAAGIVERQAAKFRGLAFAVETVDQQDVERFFALAYIVRTIGADNPKTRAIFGDAELFAQGDDFREQLDGGEIAVGQSASAVFGQRSSAETDHGDATGLGNKEQKAHHGLRIVEHQPLRIVPEHAALNRWKAKVQRQFAVSLVKQRGVGDAALVDWRSHESIILCRARRVESTRRVILAFRSNWAVRHGVLMFRLLIMASIAMVRTLGVSFEKPRQSRRGVVCCALFACSLAAAGDSLPEVTQPQVGDCVIFREGGGGYVLKAPTYWLKGSIAGLSEERRLAGRCPQIGKPVVAYSREDWVRVAAAIPCVVNDADVREVPVLRVRVTAEAWETPWSNQHGTAGWLFRGQFLNTPLRQGRIIDMDASWLERCKAEG